MVIKAIQGVARPRSGPLRFGNWEVQERWAEQTTTRSTAPSIPSLVPVRERRSCACTRPTPMRPRRNARHGGTELPTAYRALSRLPGHPNIVGVRDFFETDEGDRYVLVAEDVSGQALRVHLERPALALTLDQKYRIARELLAPWPTPMATEWSIAI